MSRPARAFNAAGTASKPLRNKNDRVSKVKSRSALNARPYLNALSKTAGRSRPCRMSSNNLGMRAWCDSGPLCDEAGTHNVRAPYFWHLRRFFGSIGAPKHTSNGDVFQKNQIGRDLQDKKGPRQQKRLCKLELELAFNLPFQWDQRQSQPPRRDHSKLCILKRAKSDRRDRKPPGIWYYQQVSVL